VRIGVDIGGTFTDFVAMGDDGRIIHTKSSTTPKELTEAILRCFRKVDMQRLDGVKQVLHGSTVAINTIIQRVGARTALLTTKGMRDIYEIGRENRPDTWNLFFHRPRPLISREWRLEIIERCGPAGEVIVPLDEDQLPRIADMLEKNGFESVAVCFLHSFVNATHEKKVGEYLAKRLPKFFVSLSSELVREMGEYERTSTTVLNAYVGPVVSTYLNHLAEHLKALQFRGVLLIMQSNGGCMSVDVAKQQPIQTTESGPVSGMLGAAHLSKVLGLPSAIAFDMGGTTAKTVFVEDGNVPMGPVCYIGGYETGQPMKVPVADIVEIGAGGGSIASVDDLGVLSVGPQSAGADPGPACYGQGGTEPTVTDANLVLGRLSPGNFLGGEMPLDVNLAKKALKRVADPKGMDVTQAADAMLQIVTNNMALAVRRISVERGVDPRDCAIIAFGGAGPLHGVGVAKELLIPKVIVPAMPGQFSALGMLVAELRHDYVQTFLRDMKTADMGRVLSHFRDIEGQARATLVSEGAVPDTVSASLKLDLRYQGQDHVLSVPVTFEELEKAERRVFVDRYDAAHMESYGHAAPGEVVEIVNLRLVATGHASRERIEVFKPIAAQKGGPEEARRKVHWGAKSGWLDTAIYQRERLGAGFRCEGPAIVEEWASTTCIFPNDTMMVDALGNLVVEVH